MAIWIHPVYLVAVEDKRSTGLHGAAYDETDDLLYGQDPLGYPLIRYTVQIFFFPFFAVTVLKRIPFHSQYLVGAHEIPVAFYMIPGHFPEIVRIADGRKYVMRFHPVVAVVRPKLQKFRKVSVPYVQIHGNCPLPDAQLVHGNCSVICKLDPADNAARRSFKPADGTAPLPALFRNTFPFRRRIYSPSQSCQCSGKCRPGCPGPCR